MMPELKHALEVIRDERRKPKVVENCTWAYTARCNLICEVCGYNSQSAVRHLIADRTIKLWKKR